MSNIVEIPAVWLQGAACTGCSVSLLNSLAPDVASLLLRELVPGKHLSLRFQANVMAGQGEPVMQVLADQPTNHPHGYVLVMEGSLSAAPQPYAMQGERDGGEIPIYKTASHLARNSLAVLCVGTCSAFGGIPAGRPNPTEAMSMPQLLEREKISVPFLNIPGCPPHPDWLVGTLMAVAMYGLEAAAAAIDELKRPLMFYGKLIHETCPRRADFDAGRFARQFGQPGCLYELGCKGPLTYADCPTRMWNSGTNWCVGAGSPCHGCVEPEFPDKLSPLYEKIDEERMLRFRLLEGAGPGKPTA